MSQPDKLDLVFTALADPTRRAILSRLARGKATVGQLAEPFSISQPAISRHLKVLEQAGLVAREVDEQRRPARLTAAPMAGAADWLNHFAAHWEQRLDQLDQVLEGLKTEEGDDP